MDKAREIPNAPGYAINQDGVVTSLRTGLPLKPRLVRGYYVVSIPLNGKNSSRGVHRLLMLAFNYVPGCEALQVDHINGDRRDNRLDNLRWCSAAENVAFTVARGAQSKGETQGQSLLSEGQVKWVRRNCIPRHRKLGFRSVAELLNVHPTTIFLAYYGANWKHL